MTVSAYTKSCVLLGFLLMVMSCGGGTGGTGSPVVASGRVTDFGSIVVTGIRFDIANATITFNGQRGSEADLQLGHVVTVQGTIDPTSMVGTAETVVFARHAEGPIENINLATNSMVVLGQIVLIDDMTQFGDTAFADLAVGNIVALSGFVDASGVLRATRVDRTQVAFRPGSEIETRGTISNLDRENQRFTLNMLIVDFAEAQLQNLPGNRLRNGQIVTVTSAQNLSDGVLSADRIALRDVSFQGAAGEKAELEGIVTRITSAHAFTVNSQPVRITPDTVFEGGTVDDLAVNIRVEVEGVFDMNGVLVVEEIELGEAGRVELQGVIDRVINADTFVINDQLVRFTSDTAFEMGTAADLVAGTQLQVEGVFDADGILVATDVEFFVDIEGSISRILSEDMFVVDGQLVRITPETIFEGGSAENIVVGAQLQVEGLFNADGVLVAMTLEFF